MKPGEPRAYVAVYYTDHTTGWPGDLGDDPAFLAHRAKKGELTWGVCRPDLRNALLKDDLVIFFATTKSPSKEKPSPYWFVGFATVAAKLSQNAIWQKRSASKYRRYMNLLITPKDKSKTIYEHYEPCEGQSHPDWLWRLVKHHGKKKAYLLLGSRDTVNLGQDERPDGGRLVLAENYIIFATDPDLTRVLQVPPIVANATKPGVAETWRQQFHPLRDLILPTSSGRRSLRTTNPRNGAHRHVRVDASVDELREALKRLVAERTYNGSGVPGTNGS